MAQNYTITIQHKKDISSATSDIISINNRFRFIKKKTCSTYDVIRCLINCLAIGPTPHTFTKTNVS